jgi:hypothetical protein
MNSSLFVQIASYRDPELQPTLIDLIDHASIPERLRIVVCWQHAPDETLDAFTSAGIAVGPTLTFNGTTVHLLTYRDASIELIDIPHFASRGACWARNQIQQHYRGERYTLQLDSHHRFVPAWDQQLIDMLESLRRESPKPVLTAYPPSYFADNDPDGRCGGPTVLAFMRFSVDGAVTLQSAPFATQRPPNEPARGCFYAAGFTFADGSFAEEVQHDPSFFFYGEEISIAARAFTHGYDIYHPHRVLAWHQYASPKRVKIWSDHTPEAKAQGVISTDWCELNATAMRRNRMLFGIDGEPASEIDFGKYGFGSVRSLRDYEVFAGLDFARRGVQPATLAGGLPNADDYPTDAAWLASLKRSNEIRVCVPRSDFGDLSAVDTVRVSMRATGGSTLHRWTLDKEALETGMPDGWFDKNVVFLSEIDQLPVEYTIDLLDAHGQNLTTLTRAIPI